MTVHQRRKGRGQPITVLLVREVADRRGNLHKVPDTDNPFVTTAWVFPQSGAKAEVPGQHSINVVRVGVTTLGPDMATAATDDELSIWGRATFQGKEWDLAAPPVYHHGTRHTRHWSLDLRERP